MWLHIPKTSCGFIRMWMSLLMVMFIQSGCTLIGERTDVVSHLQPSLYRNHGITRDSVEEGIRLPSSKDPMHLLIANPHINNITLIGEDGGVSVRTGDWLPFSQRPLQHRNFILPLPKPEPGDSLTLVLDKTGENLSYELSLMDLEGMRRYLDADSMMTGFIMGFYALAVLFSLALLVYKPALKYLYFSLYVFFSLVWILNDAGLLFQWVWPESPRWHNHSRGVFSSITMTLFALYLGRTDNAFLIRGVRSAVYAIFAFLVFKLLLNTLSVSGLFPYSAKFATMNFNAAALFTLMGVVSIKLSIYLFCVRKDLYELLAILIYCLFVIVLSLRELGFMGLHGAAIHHFDAMLFFPVQCVFMATHLYKKERERVRASEKEVAEFRIAQQRESDRRVREMEEGERRRIAQNIHDEIGSIFAALKYQLLSMRERWNDEGIRSDLERLGRLSEQGIERQYSIIDDLLFEIQSGMSLRESIGKQMGLVIREDIRATYVFEAQEDRMSDFQKTQVFRILSELLTNTIRHAGAREVSLHIRGEDELHMEYADDGVGFDSQNEKKGRGLDGIAKRVKALKGTWQISSGQDGTRCIISIPL
jgi:signal transduction histidine kinase